MVVALGTGKFYGGSLPRPRFYADVKFGPDRVDPPAPVMDPLLSWADEAHWSMGGLSFKRLRLQGRMEGNNKKLRAQHRRSDKINASKIRSDKIRELDEAESEEESGSESEPEPEPGPETEEVAAPVKEGKSRKRARKLTIPGYSSANSAQCHRTRQASGLSTELASSQQNGVAFQKRNSNVNLFQQSLSWQEEPSNNSTPRSLRNAAEKGMEASNLYLAKAWFHSSQPMTRSRSSELRG